MTSGVLAMALARATRCCSPPLSVCGIDCRCFSSPTSASNCRALSRLAWLHLPAVAWAIGIEWFGGICPLTHLEHWLRVASGVEVVEGDFIDRFVLGWLYPDGLTRSQQLVLGSALLMLNVVVYVRSLRERCTRQVPSDRS